VEDPKPPLAAGTGGPVQEPPGCGSRRPRRADAVAYPELELPRAPWKPVLLRKDADAVYPEDRSASAAMDALNVDHHLLDKMPGEQGRATVYLPPLHDCHSPHSQRVRRIAKAVAANCR
jgi:hypothetical protein